MQSDSKYHKVTLEINAFDGQHTFGKVFLDGVEVKGVRSVELRTGFNQVTEVTLTFIASVAGTIDGAEVMDSD